ncbi:helix-turn-helix domain-containing protein [Pseudoroseomonas wenyumeiae]
MSDTSIAALLNRAGKSTGRGNNWTRSRVCSVRSQQNIAVYHEGERAERGEATLDEAAEVLAISLSTVRRLITGGILPARQLCKGAPWIIRHVDLESEDVQRAATARRLRRPPPGDARQETLVL